MVKGRIISGQFGNIMVRQKSDAELELGELLVAETPGSKILMQVIDLVYGSQLSQQNLELVSGLKLEENADLDFMDPELRNYNLAVLKNLVTIKGNSAVMCKSLPLFFSEVRQVEKDDIKFLTKPKNPLFVGKLRSGSKTLDVDVFLRGDEVFSHHILIPATTGKGKSLDENEEVLIKMGNKILIKPIGQIVDQSQEFKGCSVISMNPLGYSVEFKKVTRFVKHNAPAFMYKVVTESGREVLVTGDHNLYVLREGKLVLSKTEDITSDNYLPLPLKIKVDACLKELNLFELLSDSDKVYATCVKPILHKLKPEKECINILAQCLSRPSQAYKELILGRKRIRISVLTKLLKTKPSNQELELVELTDLHCSFKTKAIFPLQEEFLQLIGYYISEGYCLNDNSLRISCAEKAVQEHLKSILRRFNLNYFFVKKHGVDVDMGLSSSLFTQILKKCGVGRISQEKRLPPFFMSLSDNDLKTLLKTYFEGDGGVDVKLNEPRKNFRISTTTKSKSLASDLCLALYRFGIHARCKKRWNRAVNSGHMGGNYYRVVISGRDDIGKFLSKVGFQFEQKNKILRNRLGYRSNTNVDIIPVSPEAFKQRRLATALSQARFASGVDCSQQIINLIELGKRRPSRDLFTRVVKRFAQFRDLSGLLKFRWDKVKECIKVKYGKKYVYDLTVEDNKTFLAGHGGVFVHNSNLTSCILWDCVDKDYCANLVLDPHDEYYGRTGIGLKDHPQKEKVIYYTPKSPPPGARTLRINIKSLKPNHFNGVAAFSDAQRQGIAAYYRRFKESWVEAILLERELGVEFYEATLAVLKRRFMELLDIDVFDGKLICNDIFVANGSETTANDICNELENARVVIVDTSSFAGAVEILIGSLVSTEIFRRYRSYKMKGELKDRPVVSVVLEEAPRVLGKEVLEQGQNIFASIAREGRKFKIGLMAITQLPSLIPREILANMNTKIILGIEMAPERQSIIESASQDLSADNRTIASLDIGEAIISSNFVKFATPVKIPLFEDLVKSYQNMFNAEKYKNDYSGVKLK